MATSKLLRTDRDARGRFAPGNRGRPPGQGAGREARRRLARLLETDPAAGMARMQNNALLQYRVMLAWAGGLGVDVDLEAERARGRWDDWSCWRAISE